MTMSPIVARDVAGGAKTVRSGSTNTHSTPASRQGYVSDSQSIPKEAYFGRYLVSNPELGFSTPLSTASIKFCTRRRTHRD